MPCRRICPLTGGSSAVAARLKGEQMSESATKRLAAIILIHGKYLINASREDDTSIPTNGTTAVKKLERQLKPFDQDGDFLTAYAAALIESKGAYRKLFEQARTWYSRAWAIALAARRPLTWGTKAFSQLTRTAGEIQDIL